MRADAPFGFIVSKPSMYFPAFNHILAPDGPSDCSIYSSSSAAAITRLFQHSQQIRASPSNIATTPHSGHGFSVSMLPIQNHSNGFGLRYATIGRTLYGVKLDLGFPLGRGSKSPMNTDSIAISVGDLPAIMSLIVQATMRVGTPYRRTLPPIMVAFE